MIDTLFKRQRVIGLVPDCAVVSRANFHMLGAVLAIQIRGLPVSTADVLHGDEMGLLCIMRGCEKAIVGAVNGVRFREQSLSDRVWILRFNLEGCGDPVVE